MFFDLKTGEIVEDTKNPTVHASDNKLRFWDSNSTLSISFTKETLENLKILSDSVKYYLGKNILEFYNRRDIFELTVDDGRAGLLIAYPNICFTIVFPAQNFVKMVEYLSR